MSVAAECLPPTRPTITKECNLSKYRTVISKVRTHAPSYPIAADSARPTDHPSCCSTVTRLNDLLLWACGPDQRTLGVCVCVCVSRACVSVCAGVARLSPPTKSTCDTDSFLRWSQCHSSLSFHPLQALSMPAQIRHIQTAKIREKGVVKAVVCSMCHCVCATEYVGVRCAYHLCVLLVRCV